MGINLPNNTKENEIEISDILKDLPRVNAPDNFEYNLMVKIQNKEFSLKTEEKQSGFSISGILSPIFGDGIFQGSAGNSSVMSYVKPVLPAAMVVITMVFSFVYVVDGLTAEDRSPLIFDPGAVAEQSEVDEPFNWDYYPESSNKMLSKHSVSETGEIVYKIGVNENDALVREKSQLNFDDSRSVDVDNYLNGEAHSPNNGNARLASGVKGGTISNRNEFNGFIIRNYDESLRSLKAKTDSIKRMMKNNSVIHR